MPAGSTLQPRTFRRGALLAVTLGAALAACTDGGDSASPIAPAEEARVTTAATPPEEATLSEITRSVALALQDQGLRMRVKNDLRESRSTVEHKLELRAYLAGQSGGILLAKMAQATGRSRNELLALVNSVRPLEFYMPVATHRASWTGGDDLLLASALDEKSAPAGYTLQGRPVALPFENAPATPTLVLVPVETNFTREIPRHVKNEQDQGGNSIGTLCTTCLDDPGDGSSGGGGGGGTQWYGLWVNEVHIGSDYEEWWKGDPEYEMILENGATSPRTQLVCSEEDKSVEPYRWNMNDRDYSQPFIIGQESEIPAGTALAVSMWEDDDTRCVAKTDKDYVKHTVELITNAVGLASAVSKKEWQDGKWISKLHKVYVNGRAVVEGEDTFVGVAVLTADVGSVQQQVLLKNDGMNNVGWLYLQWKSDTAH